MGYSAPMESIFPELFFLSYFAPLVLRVGIALIFLYDAYTMWRSKGIIWPAPTLAILGIVIGVGFVTQLAVIVAAFNVAYLAWTKNQDSLFGNKILTALSITVLLSLLITGAGGLAFDLPY